MILQRLVCLVWVVYITSPGAIAQKPETISVTTNAPKVKPVTIVLQANETDKNILRKYNYQHEAPDSLAAMQAVKSLTQQLQNDGYLTASADSFYIRHDSLFVKYFIGDQYRWARLRNGSVGDDFLLQAGYKEKLYNNTPFRPTEWVKLQESVLTTAENNGYPLAVIKLDSIKITNGQIDAVVLLDKGRFMQFDTITIEGNTRTNKRFLTRYLQLFAGQPYSQEKVARITQLLKQLPYLQLARPPYVRFYENKAQVYLFLDDRKANQLDGIVGFLPDPSRMGRKFLINGEVNLNIRNIKGSGKQLGLQWRKVERASQILDAHYVHPNIIGSPFELAGTFYLYKQDTTFLTLRPRLQLSYYTGNGSRVSFFSQLRSSRLLLSGNSLLNRNDTLQLADVKYNAYGINYFRNTLDDINFPRKGYWLDVQIAAGNKTILRNSAFERAYYDTIDLKTTQITAAWRAEYYITLSQNHVLLTRLKGEILQNARLYRNDLFQLGGLTSIRGFSDFAFYASRYAVGTLEYRLYTAPDSYVLLFYDQGYYQRNLPNDNVQEYPFGLGGGISFSTGAGIFQFIYSVGRSQEISQPISLNNSKIHFGVVSRF